MDSSLGPAVCRVCLSGETSIPYLGNAPGEPLISPCHCKGTMGLYHRSCLEHWLSTSHTQCCEICKFRYEIGSRKQGFISYLRANPRFNNGGHPRSIGSDCACLLMLTPLTLGGSALCIQSISKRLRHVDENGDLEKLHEILAFGFMAIFLITVFVFWMLFTVLFYFHDFRVWQNKNLVLYVVDQLDREDESYSRSQRHSESQRPLLLTKKIWKFFCCGGSSSQNAVVPLQNVVADISPQTLPSISGTIRNMDNIQIQQLPFTSPILRPLHTPEQMDRGTNMSASFVSVSTSTQPIEIGADTTEHLRGHVFPIVSTPSLSTLVRRVSSIGTATILSPAPASTRPTSVSSVERSEDHCRSFLSNRESSYYIPPDAESPQSVEFIEDPAADLNSTSSPRCIYSGSNQIK